MNAGEMMLQIIFNPEHACADRLGDCFADIGVERTVGRRAAQLEGPLDGPLDLLGRHGIAIFAHGPDP
jgi:hypothetical protein